MKQNFIGLDDFNNALVEFDRKNPGTVPTRMILSEKAYKDLNTIASSAGPLIQSKGGILTAFDIKILVNHANGAAHICAE